MTPYLSQSDCIFQSQSDKQVVPYFGPERHLEGVSVTALRVHQGNKKGQRDLGCLLATSYFPKCNDRSSLLVRRASTSCTRVRALKPWGKSTHNIQGKHWFTLNHRNQFARDHAHVPPTPIENLKKCGRDAKYCHYNPRDGQIHDVHVPRALILLSSWNQEKYTDEV